MSFPIVPHTLTLPILTALIGSGGFIVGIYSFINPTSAARIYGVPILAPTSPTLTSPLASQKVPSTNITVKTAPESVLNPHGTSYIYALGIRNLTAGLTILSLTTYWHFFLGPDVTTPPVRAATQHALGIVITVGALVPMVDAWVCWSASRETFMNRYAEHERSRALELYEKDSAISEDHFNRNETAIWTGHEIELEAVETGRKAGNLHAMRSLVWLAGGVWCLFG